MNKCKEDWPDAPSDVSPDAFEAFLAHVAGCPFHEKALDADEEEIRSKVRLARGIDPLGRILVGSELKRALKTHNRNHALWKEMAKEKKRPFRRIYLSNRGELVAGSGKFFICRKYEGKHRLDAKAGLQIWGVIDEGRSIPDVLLGFFGLLGVEHNGEEQFLQLENDYTVGLRVEQVSQEEFNIVFRCVENEVLERERAEAIRNNKQESSVDDATSSPLKWITEMVQRVVPSWEGTRARLRSLAWSFRSEPLSFQEKVFSGVTLALVFCIGLTVLVWLDPDHQLKAKSVSDSCEPNEQDSSTNANSKRSNGKRTRQASPPTVVKSDKADKPTGANQTELGAAASDQDASDKVTAPNDKSPSAEPKPEANAEEVKGPVAWQFQSEPPLALAEDSVAIHSGYDQALAKKLAAEMRKRDLNVRPFNARSLKGNHVAVSWSIVREDAAVTVEATLTTEGESKVLSFRSAGSCQEQACDEAVRTAVSGVFAVMRDLTPGESTTAEF
jgi:hypothetical protein